MADQGAEVIKLEPPGSGDLMRYLGSNSREISAMYASCNRNKQSVVLNLATEEGKAIVRELAAESDVFIQNFRPGVIERLGLGEDILRADHPELVYVSLNAFGEKGPYRDRPAFDHGGTFCAGARRGRTASKNLDARRRPRISLARWTLEHDAA
jgi:crotonobetainyl-CoA:carnitine CoA-transferase CaiB-like acyl-CoA transferase